MKQADPSRQVRLESGIRILRIDFIKHGFRFRKCCAPLFTVVFQASDKCYSARPELVTDFHVTLCGRLECGFILRSKRSHRRLSFPFFGTQFELPIVGFHETPLTLELSYLNREVCQGNSSNASLAFRN